MDLSQDDRRHPSSTFCASVDSTVTINPASLQKHLDSALKRISHLSQSLDRAEADNNILESRVDSLAHQLSLAELTGKTLSAENAELKRSLEEAPPSELTSLQNQVKALQHALDCQIAKHTKFADKMTARLTSAKGTPRFSLLITIFLMSRRSVSLIHLQFTPMLLRNCRQRSSRN